MNWYGSYFLIGMGGIPKTKKQLNRFNNHLVAQNIFFRNMDVALNRYTFKGLPDTVSERVILQSLFAYGCVCFFEKKGSLLALPCAPSGDGYNIYGEPLKAWVFARNGNLNEEIPLFVDGGYNAKILTMGSMSMPRGSEAKGVLLWESLSRYPLINEAIFYSDRIADTLRTLDINRKWLKRPFIPVGEDSVIPSIIEMLKHIEDNEDLIPVDTGVMDITKFDMRPVDVSSDTVNSVVSLCEWYENKYREICGVENNSQMDKKGENLITAEVDTNNQYTDLSIDKILPVMEKCLENVNSMFGTNITVKRRQEQKENVSRETMKGDNNNEHKESENIE